jgi:dTDP-4-amino-4,6-dideoxygalactose transaminase
LNTILLKKHDIEGKYIQRLSNQDGITLHKDIDSVVRNNCLWSFPIRIDKKVFKGGRDFVLAELLNSGIETRPGFVSASHLPYLFTDALPNSEILEDEILVLPSYIDDDLSYIDFVCDALLKLR